MIYRTNQGDRLDRICHSHYGTLKGRVVERVLDVNPGLATLGATYPHSVEIYLPELDIQPQGKRVRLWD